MSTAPRTARRARALALTAAAVTASVTATVAPAVAAAQQTFTSRVAFTAAAGGTTVYDLNAFPVPPGGTAPISGIGPLTFSSANGTRLDVFSSTFDPVYSYGTGNVLVASRASNPQTFTITSATPLFGFGIDFGMPTNADAGLPAPFTFTFDNGFTQTVGATGSGPAGGAKVFQFFGFLSPTAFTSVTISASTGTFLAPTFDNITTSATQVVPEPGTLLLLAGGVPVLLALAGRGARARRRMRG